MKSVKIRVIAEGPTDQLVIRELANAYAAGQSGLHFRLDFVDEQPSTDRTSGGGWEMVYKWCLANPPSEREAIYFGGGLFANDMTDLSCHALLIHMDSDICEKIGDKTNVSPVPTINSTPAVRGAFIKEVIEGWLWTGQTPRRGIYIIAPAVEATEAWLVAGLSDIDLEPESSHNISKRLAELDHLVIKKTAIPNGVRSPRKSNRNYERILAIAKLNVTRIYRVCPHFRFMLNQIISAADSP